MNHETTPHASGDIRAYTVKDICPRIGISPSTLWKYVRLGKIRVVRIGGRTLIPHAEARRIVSEGLR